MTYTLEYNGTTKTLAEWRISGMARRLQSLAIDQVSFDVAADIDAEDVFAAESTVKIFKDNVQWFVGRVEQTPRTASGRFQSHGYVLVGPWWYLQNLVYQIAWKTLANPLEPDEGTIEHLSSHIILNLTNAGGVITTKAQITSALQFCIDSGAPFQIGSIDLPDVFPPTAEVLDRMCSEVGQNQLRWTPDAVGWFDYRQEPPALHIAQRSALERVTVPVSDCTGLQITPRHDLKVPAVVIKYRRTNVVNGVGYTEYATDAAPEGATGREFKALLATIDLEGTQVNYSTAEIVCAPIAPSSVDWWKGQYRPLAEENVANITLGEPTRQTALPRELVSGSVPPWLLKLQGRTIARESIRIPATYDVMDGGTVIEEREERTLHTEIQATNLESGAYINSLSATVGQPAPIGLANYLYEATSRLHYDGSFTVREGAIGVGNVICISGARPEYEDMDAVVQSVTDTVDDGRTTVVFGPPKHLRADDIIAFLEGTRNRMRYTVATAYTQGLAPSVSSQSAKETPVKNSNSDHGKVNLLTVGSNVVIDRRVYDHMKAVVPTVSQVTLRELKYCEDGVEKRILVLASAPY